MGLPLVPMIISGALSAASSIYQGQQQAKALQTQAASYDAAAKIAEGNRRTSELLASETLKEGARDEEKFRRQARQFAASQEARLAGSGAQLSGSPLNVMADTAMGIEQDAAQIRYNTLKDRWGHEVQAVNFLNEARAARDNAANARSAASGAKKAGFLGAATSILGTATNVWSATPMNATAKGGIIKIENPSPAWAYYTGSPLQKGWLKNTALSDWYK